MSRGTAQIEGHKQWTPLLSKPVTPAPIITMTSHDRGNDRVATTQKVATSKPVYADAWYHDDAIKAAAADVGHPYRWTAANTAHG